MYVASQHAALALGARLDLERALPVRDLARDARAARRAVAERALGVRAVRRGRGVRGHLDLGGFPRAAGDGYKESAGSAQSRRVLDSVNSTVPELPISGEQRHPYYLICSLLIGNSGTLELTRPGQKSARLRRLRRFLSTKICCFLWQW